MPPGKRRQSNAMLYTLITFVGLFIVATTVAVIYYVKAEELRTRSDDLQEEMNKLASRDEVRSIGSIVGTRMPGQSNLGTVVAHLDQMVRLVKGPPVPATSAEVKVSSTAKRSSPCCNGQGTSSPCRPRRRRTPTPSIPTIRRTRTRPSPSGWP